MLGMLLAYDDEGRVIATLDYMVHADDAGQPIGLVDFAAAEAAGIELTDIWRVQGARGSGSWPEWLGTRAHEFRVIRDPSRPHPIVELEHVGIPDASDEKGRRTPIRGSGVRRRRADVESSIAERVAVAAGSAADVRDLVGGPDRPLQLDEQGRTVGRAASGSRPRLPTIAPGRSSTPAEDRPGADSRPPARSRP